MVSSESLIVEDARNEELLEKAKPTMINLRSEGLKLDLVILQNRVSGLTIDYQGISKSGELQEWLGIIYNMLSDSTPSPEGSVSKILGEAAKPSVSQPQPLKRSEDGLQEDAEPTMINVRSEGLKLDLVILQNRVSGLTIDYQGISKSGELRRWINAIKGMLSESAPSLHGPIPQTLVETPKPPISQPQTLEEKQEEPQREKEEQQEPLKQQEPLREKDYREIVFHAVDISLDTLGPDGKHAVLSLLENRYGLHEDDIADHPRGFVVLLEALLGQSARTLEREIISNIRLVSVAPGENLEAVIRSLKEQRPAEAPAEAATEDVSSRAAMPTRSDSGVGPHTLSAGID